MRGQHEVNPQRGEQFGEVPGAAVVTHLGDRGGERFPHRPLPGITLTQKPDALVLFGQVDQVKVDGEGPRDLLRPIQAPRRDQVGDVVPR
jgi:hypothetical protein